VEGGGWRVERRVEGGGGRLSTQHSCRELRYIHELEQEGVDPVSKPLL
jgi:hypothetical protein